MKKIILGLMLVFVMNFGLESLGDQYGCQNYCDSAKACCDQKNIGRLKVDPSCESQRQDCLNAHTNTPSDQCPELELCD